MDCGLLVGVQPLKTVAIRAGDPRRILLHVALKQSSASRLEQCRQRMTRPPEPVSKYSLMTTKSVANGRCSGEKHQPKIRGKDPWMAHENAKSRASRQKEWKGNGLRLVLHMMYAFGRLHREWMMKDRRKVGCAK